MSGDDSDKYPASSEAESVGLCASSVIIGILSGSFAANEMDAAAAILCRIATHSSNLDYSLGVTLG
jgi:hypothetical protein